MTEQNSRTDAEMPVEIAGAGPAGLAAAITLARAGRQVVVHEMHREVGHRFGGDYQGLENWTTKEDVFKVLERQGITTDFNAPPGDNCTIYDPVGNEHRIKSDEPLFYLVERGPGPGTLDSALLEQAQSLGVDVRFNSRLREMRGEGILAAGPRAADAIAVGYHFDTDMDDGYWAICDNELAPEGYAYLLVANGRGTVKTCMFSGFKQEKRYLERTVAAFERLAGMTMQNPQPHGGSGNFHIPTTAYSGLHPRVGEQAGFQDALWGFGMRLAISSGVLAAQSLLSGENYDRLWQRELKPQMDAAVVNRVLFSLASNRSFTRFFSYLSTRKDLRESLRWQYQFTLPKRLLSPWARRRYESHRKDVTCDHVDCHCIWCRGDCCVHD